MTKLFKNDLFLPHDSVVKAGSGAQFCVDIHGFEGGGGVQVILIISQYIRLYIHHVHVPL